MVLFLASLCGHQEIYAESKENNLDRNMQEQLARARQKGL